MLETTSVIPSKTLAVKTKWCWFLDKVLLSASVRMQEWLQKKKERKTITKDAIVTETKDLAFTPLTPKVLFWNKKRIISPSTFLLQ